MDIDTFVEVHQPQWDRLATLSARGSHLSGAEVAEIVDLYQRVASQLALVRSSAYDPELESTLSTLVTNARAVVTGSRPALLQGLVRFLTVSVPVAFYRLRWVGFASLAALVLVAAIVAVRVISNPQIAVDRFGAERIDQLVNYDFEHYYVASPADAFATEVWLNNVRVTALMLLLGILVVPIVVLLIANAGNLGLVAGLMTYYGRADVFYGLILPHGMLELTCVAFGFGAGLHMAWVAFVPGHRTRAQALASEGRSLGALLVGFIFFLGFAGALEGFLTPSTLPAHWRVGIGFMVWLAVVGYCWWFGRRADRAGETGDVSADQRSATDLIEVAL